MKICFMFSAESAQAASAFDDSYQAETIRAENVRFPNGEAA
ncbi:hypothetical protein [Pseudochrobactrum sp. MP213Fo]